MPRPIRKQLFVDPKVQGTLLLRAVMYWVMCLTVITCMILVWRIVTGPARIFYTHFDDMWFHMGPALVASLLLLPVVLLDVLRTTNRFSGPVFRIRNGLRHLAQGLPVAPIHLRRGDFWHELAEEFNAVAARVQELERNQADREPDDFGVSEPSLPETAAR